MKDHIMFDNPVINFLNFVGKLLLLNFMWVICSIPIITIGASTSAMYTVMFKVVKDTDIFIIKDFFVAFGKNFIKSTVIWLFTLLLLVASVYYIMGGIVLSGSMKTILMIISIIGAVIISTIMIYSYSLIAYFNNTIKNYILNSIYLPFFSPLKFIGLVIIWIAPILAFLAYPSYRAVIVILLITIGFALQGFASAKIFVKLYEKLTPPDSTQNDTMTE